MKLFYLTEHNLRNRLFIQDFVFNYKLKEKAIVLHAPFGDSIRDSRFVAKRISSLLSEAMVYNNFLMGDQRDCFVENEQGHLEINPKAIHELHHTAKLLVIGPIVRVNGQAAIGDSLHMLQAIRQKLEIDDTFLFSTNPKSPLVAQKPLIEDRAEVDRLLQVYEEEAEILELAYRMRPVRLVSPMNYSMS